MKKLVRRCPICGATTGEVLHQQYFSISKESSLPSFYEIVSCSECGFDFADTPAKQADYDIFYQDMSKYEDVQTGTGGGQSEADIERLAVTAATIAKFIRDKQMSILDIGCANGGLLSALKELGYLNITGIDPSPGCIKRVNDLGFCGLVGGLFDIPSDFVQRNKAGFDLIILSHVLEHVCDLAASIENIKGLLRTGGMVYVEVPDAARYVEHYVVPYYYFDCEHINHFDSYALTNLMSVHRLECVKVEQKNIIVDDCRTYPAVYGIYQNTGNKHSMASKYSFVAKNNIMRYVEMSRLSEEGESRRPIWDKIEKLSQSQDEILIWGAGSYTSRLLATTPLGKCNIVGFIDKDSKKQGSNLLNIKISSPDIIHQHQGVIVVSAAIFAKDIVAELKNMGIKNRILVME